MKISLFKMSVAMVSRLFSSAADEVMYPASLVHCETLAEVKSATPRPEISAEPRPEMVLALCVCESFPTTVAPIVPVTSPANEPVKLAALVIVIESGMYASLIAVPCQTPVVIVPTVVRLARVVRAGRVVVAARRASKRVLVQYRLVPSDRSVVELSDRSSAVRAVCWVSQ